MRLARALPLSVLTLAILVGCESVPVTEREPPTAKTERAIRNMLWADVRRSASPIKNGVEAEALWTPVPSGVLHGSALSP